jgi:uncharacterized membrane protein
MEKDKTITIYTVIFLLVLSGFIGFLFVQGSKDSDRNDRIKGRVNSGMLK